MWPKHQETPPTFMQWWFILQSTKYICFNAAFEILFRPAQFHEQSVQPSTQQTFDQHLVQACQWKQHIHNSYPTQQLTPTNHLPRDFTVTNIQPIQLQRLQAGLQLGSGHGQFSRNRDLSPELRAAAWKKIGRCTYFILFYPIFIYSTWFNHPFLRDHFEPFRNER